MNQRDKVLYKNTVINYTATVVYYLFNFLAIPLSLSYLGKERFGVFQTILTFVTWAMLANLGIGNGLRNKISEFLGTDKKTELKELIGTAFTISSGIVLTVLLIGSIFFWYFFDPSWLFSNLTISLNEVKLTFFIAFVFFSLNLFFSLFSSIAYGIHKSYIVTIVQVVQYALYSLFLYILIKSNTKSNLIFVSVVFGASLLISQSVSIYTTVKNSNIWPPRFHKFKVHYKELLNTSIGFFVLQLSSVVLFTSDNFIVSKLLGPNDVTEYSIASKVFFLIISLFSIVLIQIWNSTTDALVKKDFDWIKKTVLKLHKILFILFIATIVVALLFNYITRFWIGQSFQLSLVFRLLFALYVLFHGLNAIYVNILNGLGKLKLQTFAYILAAGLNFILSYFFITKMQLGISGILYSKIICVTLTALICYYDYRRFIKYVDSL